MMLSTVIRVHHSMAPASRDEPPVHRESGRPSNQQRENQTPQKRPLPGPASIAPGMASMIALSTSSMIVIDTVSEPNASFRTTGVNRGGEPRRQQRPHGEPVAKEEGECHR
jgi:hypothetical protein